MTTLSQAGQDAEYLTPEREATLVAKMRAGCKRSRDQLVMSHVKLCNALARKYAAYGHEYDDLHSCCVVGLVKTAERFDPSRGARFATAAQWWCRSELNEYMMAQRSLVKIGTTSQQKTAYFGLNKAKARLGIDGNNLSDAHITALADELKIPASVVAEMNQRLQPDHSLNVPRVNKSGTEAQDTLQDCIVDESLVPADELLIAAEQKAGDTEALEAALATLTENERYAVERRVLTDDPDTLDTLAAEKGRSRERIRQWEVRGREKIAAFLRGEVKSKTLRTKAAKKAREEKLEFVRRNIDKMSNKEMALALNMHRKTVESYSRKVRAEREKLPLAA